MDFQSDIVSGTMGEVLAIGLFFDVVSGCAVYVAESCTRFCSFDTAADIVFLTSSPGFAYESYGVRALEYLLKPISGKLLFPVLDKLSLREQRPQDGLTLKAGATLVRVPFSQLAYVEVSGKHLYFNLTDGQVRE